MASLLIVCILVAAIVWFFTSSVSNLSNEQLLEDKQQLEQALVRACVACYAVEGKDITVCRSIPMFLLLNTK